MEDIETYQKDKIDSRFDASKKLSEVEREINEPDWNKGSDFWETLTGEANENTRQFKRNLKERLLPSITKGTEEDLKKVCSILEKFAQYLLNPIIPELKDLNKSMSELSLYPQEKSRLVPFFGHPYMHHACFLAIFIVSGAFAYYLSKYLGSSTDSAISNGFYVPVALIAGYMIFMVKKN
ncbi:MAG: hypothetical protein FIB08_10020 [Candidatus Methanoperedens sp.]|nr:hypothetical protein [Candidatus Methanoperedens sp.]